MQMTKKVLSVVLAVMMVVSMMSVMAVTANAAPADFSSDTKTVFVTDSQNWDSDGALQAYYWKVKTTGYDEHWNAITETVAGDWVSMTYLYDNSQGQSVYGVVLPDDANWVLFNRDNTRQTTDTTNVYDGSWWYIDGNKACQPCSGSAFDTCEQTDSLSDDFVTNTGADRYYVLDGRYYFVGTNGNISQYNNTAELMVAEVNGNQYSNVNDAVKAAGANGTVTLINDINSNVFIGEDDYSVTLDLNGHTITNTSGSGITLGSAYPGGNTFTIKDTSAGQTGAVTINKKYAGDGCVSDSSGWNVVIEGGTYTSDANALYISSDQGWEIKGGTFNGDVKVVSALDVTGGAINGDINATGPSWKVDPAEVTISGGTVDGDLNSTNGSTFEVSGGTFTSDVSAYTTSSTYQNANGEVVAKAANTIYDDGDFATAAAEGGDWYIVADVNGDGVTVTSNLKIWNTDKDHTIAGDITVANGKSIAKGGKKKVTFTGTTTLNGGSVSDANFTEIIVANDPYVHGQINNVPSGAVIKNGDGDRIVYDAISLAYAAKNGSEVYLVDDISDMYMTMNVNSGNFVLHGDGHTVNFTFKGDYASAIGKNASIAIDDLTVTVASGKALKSFIKANAADDNTGTVTINDVSATGFSTDDVYTGGGTWTFTDATVTSATQPECPEDWKAVDNNDGTWSIVAKVYVAQVGDNKYETFAEAVEAANGSLIKIIAKDATPYVMSVGQTIVTDNYTKITIVAPEGAYAIHRAYDSTAKTYTFTVVDAVASFSDGTTTKYYDTLNAAISAVPNATSTNTATYTVNLLKDSTELAINVGTASAKKNVVIDLGDNTLTLNRNYSALFIVRNGSNAVVQNGKVVFDTAYENASGFYMYDNATRLTLADDLEVEATDDTAGVYVKNGTFTSAADITSEDSFAISTNGSETKNATINVTGGELTSTNSVAVYLPGDATTTLTDATVTGATAVYAKSGDLTINGGTYTANGNAADYTYNGNGCNPTGDAIVVDSCGYPGGAPAVSITGNPSIDSANGVQIGDYTYGENTDAEVTAHDNSMSLPEGLKWVETDTQGVYTVAPMDLQDLADEGFDVPKTAGLGFVDSTTLSGINVPAKASILGVQLRQAPENGEYDEGNGTNALRFITAVDKEFLQNQDITDYGYLITIGSTTRFQTCKNTTNNTLTSGADDDLEYFTAAIYNIPDGNTTNIKVQFVFKTAGNDQAAFATYKNAGQYELNTNYKDVYDHFNS